MSVQSSLGVRPLTSDYLHHSAYEGQLEKVQTLLKEYCVYQKCTSNLTALMYSLSNRKLDVFKELWKIYECDIKFVRDQITNDKDLTHPIFIGFGIENIEEIEQMMKQYSNNGDNDSSLEVIVLLKSDNFTPTKVIKMNTTSGNFSTGAKIVGACIENGVLDLNERNDRDEGLIDIAFNNGLLDVGSKIMEYGVTVNKDRIKKAAVPQGEIDGTLESKGDVLPELNDCRNIDKLLDGSWEYVKNFMDRTGASVDELICTSGLNLFHEAIKCSQQEIAEKLWDLKPNYKIAANDGYFPIHDAIRKGYKNLVTRILNDDREVILQQDRSGYNCLHHMTLSNWLDEVAVILEKHENLCGEFFKNVGVGVTFLKALFGLKHAVIEFIIKRTIHSVTEDTFYIILNTIAGSNCSSTLKFLLETKKIDLGHGPESPIIVAFRHNQIESAKLLLDYAEQECLNKIFDADHNNLLKYAIFLNRGTQGTVVDSTDENSKYNELIPILDNLIAKGVDYKNINSLGQNLLHIATDGCNIYAMKKLLELGVDENQKDNLGFPPIYYAKNIASIQLFTNTTYVDLPTYLFVERPTLLEYILENGASADAANAEKQTALYFTTRLDVCKILLKHKANVNHIDINGNTPIHAAFLRSVYKTATYLLESEGANFTCLDQNGKSYLIYFLVAYQKFPKLYGLPAFLEMVKTHCNDIDEVHRPYLHMAIEKNVTLAKLLLSQENIDIHLRNTETGDTSLHCAAYFNKYDIISELLTRDIDVNVLNNFNQTPLHMAAQRQQLEAIEILLQHNANVDVVDKDGETALHGAAQKEESGELFCSLLQKSVNPKTVNKKGKSPCDLLPVHLRKLFYFV